MLKVAGTTASRLRGLIGADGAQALLLPRCNWIHTWFMSYPIDVYYLDQRGGIVRQVRLTPWKLTCPVRGAVAVLEVPPGVDGEVALRESARVLDRQ
ncbi:MAG: DUF192 domain-containing protein [Peptococcaceae bacterium]|jgi:uncharacterized membrane protein (UPF0127 family)|nr:DUF192 domain-containing protein [Peptococcaceae bacterium]